jgi:hypothetical protein
LKKTTKELLMQIRATNATLLEKNVALAGSKGTRGTQTTKKRKFADTLMAVKTRRGETTKFASINCKLLR